jgi:hypothetical protein
MQSCRVVAVLLVTALESSRAWTQLSGNSLGASKRSVRMPTVPYRPTPSGGVSSCRRLSHRRPRRPCMDAGQGPQDNCEVKIEGLLFDCDGTLVNSMPVWANNWVETCREFGLELDEERFYQLAGLTIEETLAVLCQEQGKVCVCAHARAKS